MAITFDELKEMVSKEGLRFFEDPRTSRILLGMSGMFGRFEVMISLDHDGQFLQFRTMNYLQCPPGHAHLSAVLQLIAELNCRLRLVKFGWDSGDGEIMAYADLWLMDAKPTQQQLNRMLTNFMPSIDMSSRRLRETLDSGTDPGELDPQESLAKVDASSLPEPLKKLLDKLKGKDKGTQDKDSQEAADKGKGEKPPSKDELETI